SALRSVETATIRAPVRLEPSRAVPPLKCAIGYADGVRHLNAFDEKLRERSQAVRCAGSRRIILKAFSEWCRYLSRHYSTLLPLCVLDRTSSPIVLRNGC